MVERVAMAGVGMVPFATPSRSDSYDLLAEGAVRAALADAGINVNNNCSTGAAAVTLSEKVG